ncbi:mPR-like GPCR protein [Annulohypoxylon truncatum]|uniref:mPR-like GPCR protein n=1 Tax=Annulohypoxylon truncatum TaxID=327061 RepID=UPI0020087A0D|nr:mPR-like GPCR protein [Annulohypoxylon truncatum]KAI1210167.1 mPR-like GPCR protein [Annulohypoxylon truncatum]
MMALRSTELNTTDHDSADAQSSTDEKQQTSLGITESSTRGSECESRDFRHHPLLSYEEIPEWYQDNPYVRNGYRPVSHSARACFGSWIYVHNETMNIYTHLVPAVALLVIGLAYIITRLRHRNGGDAGIVAVQMVSAVACLGFSSAYHTLMCHSRQVEALWLRFDFVGIILLILGSFISGIYVGFWCELLERKIYWSMIGSLATISIVIVLAPTFQGPRWRTLRLLTFVSTGLSGLAPIIHGICMFGFAQMMKQSGLPFYLAEGGLFLLGAVVYATRFPESVSPGKFDIYGSSHQIFHILVVIATVVHLAGVLDALDYNYYNRQCIP